MADWVTISSLATAGGTLVLAVATFSSVRSANRSARVAERSLLAGLRPVLIPSKEEDPVERVRFGDQQLLSLPGHGGGVIVAGGVIYLGIALRNGGSGLAVLHGWRARRRVSGADQQGDPREELDGFRRQQLDIYVPAGETGIWLGALRDPDESGYAEVLEAMHGDRSIQVDLLYGDHEGGQRTIARFVLAPWPEDGEQRDDGQMRALVIRYWSVDGEDPR
jgi:hypothetical protein